MTPNMRESISRNDRCPMCDSNHASNLGHTTSFDQRRYEYKRVTLWHCLECDGIYCAEPKQCKTGCGYIDAFCKCEDSRVGFPRLINGAESSA